MPFTPIHMGPGALIKSVLQGSFSLMVFGWSQVVMDIQPLIVLITQQGHLHGFTHTYLGASLLAVFCGLSGKYLAEIGLKILAISSAANGTISFRVSILSAFIGCFSHVMIDSVMHADMAPWSPLSPNNALLGLISVDLLHRLCLYAGLLGGVIFYLTLWLRRRRDLQGKY